MENINDILKNQTGGENNQPQNSGYQNPAQPGGGYISPKPPKKDNKKLIAIIAIIAAVAVVIVTVIGVFALGSKPQENLNNTTFTNANTNQSTEPPTETATETTMQGMPTTEATTAPEGGWAKADISAIAKDIEINGNKLTLPCTIGELKAQGWEYNNEIPRQDEITPQYKAFGKDNTAYFDAVLYSHLYDYQKDLEENVVTAIRVDPFQMQYLDSVKFGNITKNTTRQEFLNSFEGVVEERVFDNYGITQYYYTIYDINSDKSNLSVAFEDDKLILISLKLN